MTSLRNTLGVNLEYRDCPLFGAFIKNIQIIIQ